MSSLVCYGVEFEDVGRTLTLRDIEEFEQCFQVVLSKGYRDFILKVNGGTPWPNGFDLNSDRVHYSEDDYSDILRWLAAGGKSITEKQHSEVVWEVVANSHLPIYVEKFLPLSEEEGSVRFFSRAMALAYGTPLWQIPIAYTSDDLMLFLVLSEPYRDHVIVGGLPAEERASWDEIVSEFTISRSFNEFLSGLSPASVRLNEGYTPSAAAAEVIAAFNATMRKGGNRVP